MLLNYLKLSLRLMARSPFFTMINVAGLSLGLAVSFLLWQYSQNELKTDQFHKDWNKIYRFGWIPKWTDDKVNWLEGRMGSNDAALTSLVASRYSEIEAMTRILPQQNIATHAYIRKHGSEIHVTVNYADGSQSKFLENRIVYADPNLFSFFDINLIDGELSTVLSSPGSVILSEKSSLKYFGTIHSSGRDLLLNDSISLRVTGIFQNLPANTHLNFEIAISSLTIQSRYEEATNPYGPICYFKINPASNATELARRINKDLHAKIKDVAFGNYAYGDSEIFLQPLSEVAFEHVMQDMHDSKSKVMLHILQYASVVILILAWINYVNLTVARNRKRLKELGIREIVGASRFDLFKQLLTEAVIINMISVMLALTFIQLVKGPVQLGLGIYLLAFNHQPLATMIFVVFAFLGGPMLTSFFSFVVLQGRGREKLFVSWKPHDLEKRITHIFTSFQYAMAISLVVFVFTMYNQVAFILQKNIGFNRDEILVVDLPVINRTEAFKTNLQALTSELRKTFDLSVSQSVPGDDRQQSLNLYTGDEVTGIKAQCNGGVDEEFISLYDIELIAGRNFQSEFPADSTSILISESSALRLGYQSPEEVIGKKFFTGIRAKSYVTAIGVFKDYKLKPFLTGQYFNYGGNTGLMLTYKNFVAPNEPFVVPGRISIRVSPINFKTSLTVIEETFHEYLPAQVFNWYFLDDMLNQKYHQQIISRNQVTMFSLLAVGIACLGLLGMISNNVLEKAKEIGIRKILGAQLYQITQLLMNITFKQILIATLIGIPMAYYLTQQYLKEYSDRVTLQWWYFGIPVLIFVLLMIATVASVIYKAAMNSPVDALKCE